MKQPRLPPNNQIQLNPSNAHPLDVQYYPQQQNNTNANPQYGDVQDSTYRNLNNKGSNQNSQNVQVKIIKILKQGKIKTLIIIIEIKLL